MTKITAVAELKGAKHDPFVMDTANLVLNDGKKIGLKVCITQTPHDFYYMYDNGPHSCMQFGDDGGEGQNRPFDWMKMYKIHPMSSFIDHPFVKGLYIKDENDLTRFRALVYSDKPHTIVDLKDAKWHRRSSYYHSTNSSEINRVIEGYLKELGVDVSSRGIRWHKPFRAECTPFTVGKLPPFFALPYFDDHGWACSLNYDRAKKKFIWAGSNTADSTPNDNFGALYRYACNKPSKRRSLTVADMENNRAVI